MERPKRDFNKTRADEKRGQTADVALGLFNQLVRIGVIPADAAEAMLEEIIVAVPNNRAETARAMLSTELAQLQEHPSAP